MKFTFGMGVVEVGLGMATWILYYLVTGDKSFGGAVISLLIAIPVGYGAFYLMNWKNIPVDVDIDSDYFPE